MAADKDVRYTITAEDRFSGMFARLKRDLADGTDQLGRIAGVAARASGALGLVAFGGAAGFGAMFRQMARDVDALNDASDALGDSVENISALEDVARRNGEGLELVVTAVAKLNKVLGEAKADSPLAKVLAGLGLNAAELRRLDPSEALQRVAVALQGVQNDGNRARIIQELFGKSSKEAASFLKDLADAGQLNATVTSQQAAEVERFNKQLASLSTNVSNAGRGIASTLVPLGNEVASRLRASQEVFGGFINAAVASLSKKTFTDAGEGVRFYADEVTRLRAAIKNLDVRGSGIFDKLNAESLREQVKELEQFEKFYRRVFQLTAADNGQSDPRELARRGRGPALLPRAPELPGSGGAGKVSEAERYLESLQRQAEKLEDLTAVQQLLSDIENRRIDGLTPKLRTRLFLEAANVDVLKAQDKALRDQQQSLDDLIASTERRSSELEALLANTSKARADKIERQVDIVLSFARANPGNEAIQRQALEAVKQLRAEFDRASEGAAGMDKNVEKLNVTIDRFADQTVDAMLDMANGVDGASERLFDAFKRDLLREFIEEPVRDSMRNVVAIIRNELSKASEGGGALAQIFEFFKGLGSGQFGSSGNLGPDSSGFGTRASGGKTKAGQVYRWQENGVEFFRANTDGEVLTEQQAMAAGGAQIFNTNNITIVDARDPVATARRLRAELDERDARALRAARFGLSAAGA